jgi:hypothetical protein
MSAVFESPIKNVYTLQKTGWPDWMLVYLQLSETADNVIYLIMELA